MKHVLSIMALVCLPVTVMAQDSVEDGRSLMERGAQMFLDGMMEEMAPTLEGLSDFGEKMGPALRSFTSEMGPALAEVFEQVEDWSIYEPPEILPNGDIIINRKPEPQSKEKPPAIFLDETPQFDL